ncbi:MAG: beta-ketoacyl synthase N-terminal-like domain-containing protein [Desulfobacteraceae bacterium]|nr:beta-ketoacyl synthase N-terminal-like domain-containing protein [Desulfobacteraceae bacterium]
MNLSIDIQKAAAAPEQESVAVVGMACVFPKAPDLNTFWHNIVNKVDAVEDVPPQRWDAGRYYNPQTKDCSQIYAKRGGYLPSPMAFDPAEFGIMPAAVTGGEPDQFLVLKAAADALRDAGIKAGQGLERADFILGRGAYLGTGGFNLLQRSFVVDQAVRLVGQLHPQMAADDLDYLRKGLLSSLLPFEADTAPAVMPNISAGRVANRLGFMGPNYNIDAACASSLYAVDIAVANLLNRRCDLAMAGGVHIFNQTPFLSVFCALGAMSRREKISSFDQNADGLLPGEGVGFVVLKRRADAERDGNRIYALIRGVGTSSDGRGGSVAAPQVAGEVLALRRAYETAGVSPATIGLIEAHGTATLVGDGVEMESLTQMFGAKADGAARHCALGSVKSMIGHAMPAAGVAGLIKTILALHHKVLPPTLNCETPNPKFKLEQSPFYINTETRPWFPSAPGVPRRAGVNAFGFGGVNAHVVLEEYAPEAVQPACGPAWDAALFLFSAGSQADLASACDAALARLAAEPQADFMAWSEEMVRAFRPAAQQLSIIAESPQDLGDKLRYARNKLHAGDCKKIKDVKGIYYFADPLGATGKLAFMFPGEGSPYTNMLLDLCLYFPEVKAVFEAVDAIIGSRTQKSRFLPSQFIFPATLLSPAEKEALAAEFWKVDSGLQAILAASFAMQALLARFGVRPAMIVGHSAGEYCAWVSSGILEIHELYRHQERIAAIYSDHRHPKPTAMTAVSSRIDKVQPILESVGGPIFISNDNCPHQVVVVGEVDAVAQFKEKLKGKSILCTDLPSQEVHHTPMAATQGEALFQAFGAMSINSPKVPVYSAITTTPYPAEAQQVHRLMVDYWLKPLNFRQTVEAMHRDGARIFIEVGPGNNLCGFVDDTLRGKPFMSVPANNSRRSGINQFCHLLGMLVAQHVPVELQAYAPLSQRPSQAAELKAAPKTTMHMELGVREPRLKEDELAYLQQRLNVPAPAAEVKEVKVESASPSTLGGPVGSATQQRPAPSIRTQIMQRYMDNMSQFLTLQKEMMAAWSTPRPPMTKLSEWPLVGGVKSLEPGKSCVVERRISLKEDRFLEDHTFSGKISSRDPHLLSLVVTPMTINLEMMAEAAALMQPQGFLLEIKNARASRWVEVPEEGGATLVAEARQTAAGEIHARLIEAGSKAPSAELSALFGAQYPPAALAEPLTAAPISAEAARRAQEIYQQKYMLHGPRFQVLAGWTQIAPSEVEAFLRAPADHDLFAGRPAPRLLLNPLLLDGCAQLVGHWAQISLRERYVTFPAGIESAKFFSAPPRCGELLRARMRIRDVDDHFVRANLKITRADGRTWVVIQGWTHHCFSLPAEYYRFNQAPLERTISQAQPSGPAAGEPRSVQCRAPYYPELRRTIWKKAVGHVYLNRSERTLYRQMLGKDEERADQWLMGRVVAKDAVRLYLTQFESLKVFPADFEIKEEENGRLIARGPAIDGLAPSLSVTITTVEQFASAQALESTAIREQEKRKNG